MTPMSDTYSTIRDLITTHATARPGAVAIESLSGVPLTYAALTAHLERTCSALRSFGIGRLDRIAFALPDGPEAAVAFLSIASAAVAAPLNPASRAGKLAFYLQDIPARAVIVPAGAGGAIVDTARELSIDIIELVPHPDGSGAFDLRGPAATHPVTVDPEARPDNIALVLYTSGTTARPKLVPLTHENLAASARYTAAALELGPTDRALHIVPMFHVQGLVTTLLSPLAAGGTVVCTPGFQPSEFLAWLADRRPTWYTAVPTMHRTIVERARQLRPAAIRTSLRFIRSSAAALTPRLSADLEQLFRVPILDGYGMTEAAPIIACNPLPPRVRKPGSVGLAAGPELTVVDTTGVAVGPGVVGEIAVRGANVMVGYERDPEANAAAFVNGWFRTGDQGYLDADGYLFLTGRLKEIINRGGEKIAPREIEEALLDHPAVQEVAAFGITDERLGQAVGAAVVLRQSARATERELRDHIAARLAFFKIPSRILFLDELPKGPTGKLERVGLAATLQLTDEPEADTVARSNRARTPLERDLVRLWCEVLDLKDVGIHDNFFVLGGTSISFVEMLYRIRKRFGIEHLPNLVQSPTIADAAKRIEEHVGRPAAKLTVVSSQNRAERISATERRLMAIWKDVLCVEPTAKRDHFFELGGELVPVALLFEKIRAVFGQDLPVRALVESPTIEGLARTIDAGSCVASLVAPLQTAGTGTPVFGIHDGGGYFFHCGLASRISQNRPFYTIQAETHLNGWCRPYRTGATIEGLASRYIQEIKTIQPSGPYCLVGVSFGGVVAFEMARQLRAQDEPVASLFLFSSFVSNNPLAAPRPERADAPSPTQRLQAYRLKLAGMTRRDAAWHTLERMAQGVNAALEPLRREVGWRWSSVRRQPIEPTLIHQRYLKASRGMVARYRPAPFDGRIVLFRGMADTDPAPMWEGLALGGLEVHDLPGGHLDMMRPPMVETLAGLVRERIEAAESERRRKRAPVVESFPVAAAR